MAEPYDFSEVQAIDILDMQRSGIDASIRVESARMVELGGYLQYLAVAKMASVSEQSQQSQGASE